MTPTSWKRAYIATKSSHKKEKGQIPFPTDRALNEADRVKKGLYRAEKNITAIKRPNDGILLPAPRTQPVLPLFPFKRPIPGK